MVTSKVILPLSACGLIEVVHQTPSEIIPELSPVIDAVKIVGQLVMVATAIINFFKTLKEKKQNKQ